MPELGLIVTATDKASGVLSGVKSSIKGLGGVASTVAAGGVAALAAGLAGIAVGGIATGKAVVDFAADLNEGLRTSQAQLGLTEDEMDGLRDSARAVFEEGFGDDVGDVIDDMTEVRRVTGLTGDELEHATKQAQIIADTFELDVAESVMIADSAVSSGLVPSMEEANDLITKGFQMGLAEDFGDTINEYSGDFARLGLESSHVLSMMNAGLEAGAHNTDVIADGFREMNIRLMEGGDGVGEAFDAMGMDFKRIQGFIAAGEEDWGDYIPNIVEGLQSIENEVDRNAAGVEIFGSKWEDIGGEVFLAAGEAKSGVLEVSGATDAAGEALSEGFGEAVKRLKRTVISSFDPLGEKVMGTIDKMAPFIDNATAWLGEKIPEAIDLMAGKWNSHFPAMRDGLLNFWGEIKPVLAGLRHEFGDFATVILPRLNQAWDIAGVGLKYFKRLINDDLKPAIAGLVDALGLGSAATEGIGESMGDFVGSIISTGVKNIIIGIGKAIKGVSAVIRTATGVVDRLKTTWNKHFPSMRDSLLNFWRGIRPGLLWVRDRVKAYYTTFLPRFKDSWDRIVETFHTVKGMFVNELKPAIKDYAEAMGIGTGETDSFMKFMGSLAGLLNRINIEVIIFGIKTAVKGMTVAIRASTGFINSFKRGLDGVKRAAQWVKDRINDLKHAMSTGWDWVPDWLIPGSPTPFETGLRGIADAAQDLQKMDVLTAPPSLATGSSGGQVIINNRFGAGSVRSDQDILDIADKIARQTRLRTGEQWL